MSMTSNRLTMFLAAMMLAMVVSPMAKADEIRLEDGSTITGDITHWTAEVLTVKTSFAGELPIARKLIKFISADEPVVVQVDTGDKIVGKLVIDEEKGQLLTGTTFGDLKVVMGRVTSITAADDASVTSVSTPPGSTPAVQGSSGQATPDQTDASMGAVGQGAAGVGVTTPSPAPADTAGPVEPPFEPAVPLYTAPPAKWTARVEAGMDGATGNTERMAARGRIEARRTTESERLLFYFQGTYAKQNGARSANELLGGAEIEVDLTKRLFVFGKGSLEYDEFENLDLRTLVSGGLGYFWIREDEQFLKTRFGIGYMHETFDNGDSEDTGILELGVDYMKQITPWVLYNHSTTYYPTLRSASDYRIEMENAAEIPITKDKDWKVRLGIKHTYDSQPEPDVERLDTTYFANLVWDFK